MITAILDLADRQGNWWPFTAGFLGAFTVLAAMGISPWLWLPAGAGLVMAAIRPVGTQLRYRRLIREARRTRQELVTATATLTLLDQLDRLTGRVINALARREK